MRKIFENKFNIGLIILILCLPSTNLLSGFTGQNCSWLSDVLMVVGLLLILDFDTLFSFKLFLRNWKDLLCIFLLIWSITSSYVYGRTDASISVVYSFFSLAMAIAFSTNSEWCCKEDFVKILFYVSGILSVLCAYYLTDGLTNFGQKINSVYYANTNTIIVNRVTISALPATCLYACMAYKSKYKIDSIFKWVFVIFSLIAVVGVNKRGRVIAIVVSYIVLLIYKSHEFSRLERRMFIRRLMYVVFVIVAVIAIAHIPWVANSLGETINSVHKAIATLLGDTSNGVDSSATVRYSIRSRIFSEYSSYSFLEILFGKGYMYGYLDFPLLQAVIDGGWIFGLLFMIIHLLIPLKNLFGFPQSDYELFVKLFSVNGILNLFYCGVPYGQGVYIYPLLVLFLTRIEKNDLLMPKESEFE